MISISPRNVNAALAQGLQLIHHNGVREPSRNGEVIRVPQPVSIVYELSLIHI